jgi:hypothetical protein
MKVILTVFKKHCRFRDARKLPNLPDYPAFHSRKSPGLPSFLPGNDERKKLW